MADGGPNGTPAPPVAEPTGATVRTDTAGNASVHAERRGRSRDTARRRADGMPVGRPFVKGQANPGRGRPPGSLNESIKDIRQIARQLLEDKTVLTNTLKLLRRGRLNPAVWAKLYDYAYGKPVDRVRLTGVFGSADPVAVLEAWNRQRVGGADPLAIPAAAGSNGDGT